MQLLLVSRSLVLRALVICTVIGSLFAAGCMTSGNSEAQLSVATLSGGLPAGSISVGGAYPATSLRASGGTAPYTWAVTSGNLPPGLALTSAGTISGSPTTTTGSPFSFTVTVTDAATPAHTASGVLSISINGMMTITTATGSLPTTGEAGSAYPSTTLTETGGVGPFNWTINSGSLPNGLSLSSTGSISGTISPTTTPGTFSFTANIKDSQGNSVTSGTISIKVDAALVVTPPTLPAGVLNVSYSSPAFMVSGGSGSGYTFSLASGALPTPLTINSASGIISGVPTASGSYTFALKVMDSLGYTVTTGNLIIVIKALPAITSASSTSLTAGTAGSFTVTATGFPIATLAETAALPSGVTFTDNKNNTGTLAWTAAVASGSHGLTFTASNGVLPNATQSFTLTVNAVPTITSASSTSFTAGTAGSFTVTATGFPITTLAETAALPSGASFTDNKNNTGTLAWTAAVASGSYNLTFTASNGVLPSATQNFTLAVDKAPAITSVNSASFTAGTAGSFTVTATGFPIATLAETSALPGGVTFTDNKNNTGTLAWTVAAVSGVHSLTFTASNGVLPNTTQSFTLTVNAAPAITSATSMNFTAGTAGTFTVTATGFPIATLAETTALPTGVTFTDNKNNTGTLAWTAAVAIGPHALTFTASNGISPNATQSFTLTAVSVPASITSSAGGGQSAAISTAFATALQVTVKDMSGNLVPNVTVTFTAPASGASGTFANGTATTTAPTNSSGVATAAAFTANASIGSYIVTASVSGVSTNASFTMTNNSIQGACPNNAKLTGGYALMLQGWTTTYRGKEFIGMIGSFQADGNGNITAGTADENDPWDGPTLGLTFTGTYCLASNNLGTMAINQSAGGNRTLEFSLGSDGNGNVEYFDTNASFQGSGLLRKQQSTAFSTSELTGTYVFGLIGVFDSSYPDTRAGMVGAFSTNGSGIISGGEFDYNSNYTMGAGAISVSSNGHGTATLDFYGSGLSFSIYVVSSSELLMMENTVTSPAGVPIVIGQVIQQVNPSFSGSMVIASEGYYGSQTTGSQAQVGLLSTGFDVNGPSFSVSQDVDYAGVYSTAVTETANYTVGAFGRISFANSVCNDPPNQLCLEQFIPYLTGPNKGFIKGTGSNVDFGKLVPQSGMPSGGFTNTSLNGTYFGGSQHPTDPFAGEEIGNMTFDGIGAITGVSALNGASGPKTGSIGASYVVSPNGRVVATCTSNCSASRNGQAIIYIVSPTQIIVLPSSMTDPYLIDFKQ
jgi:Putative Ig domain